MSKNIFILVVIFLISSQASAFFTEIAVTYGYDKKSFDADNTSESESVTSELSFYFWERIALELSYTDSTTLLRQKASSTDPSRATQQKTLVAGADMILLLADRKAFFQPFLKGGGAQVTRRQEIKIDGYDTQTLEPETAIVPTYGAGLKILITDSLALKASYSAWRTPVSGSFTNDSALRAGVSWIF